MALDTNVEYIDEEDAADAAAASLHDFPTDTVNSPTEYLDEDANEQSRLLEERQRTSLKHTNCILTELFGAGDCDVQLLSFFEAEMAEKRRLECAQRGTAIGMLKRNLAALISGQLGRHIQFWRETRLCEQSRAVAKQNKVLEEHLERKEAELERALRPGESAVKEMKTRLVKVPKGEIAMRKIRR